MELASRNKIVTVAKDRVQASDPFLEASLKREVRM